MFAHEQRARVVALCVDLSRRGYLAGTGGNVALRIDAECFAVTPSAIDYLCKVVAWFFQAGRKVLCVSCCYSLVQVLQLTEEEWGEGRM